MDQIKRAFGQDVGEESPLVTEVADATSCASLSWSTRIKCFAVCFIAGIVCSVVGGIFLWTNMRAFAMFYSLGSVSSLAGSFFLMGPIKQSKNMFKEKRYIASIVMIVSLVLTLFAALWWKKNALALIFVVIQYLALTWYCLSYIPFARDAVKKCFEACLG